MKLSSVLLGIVLTTSSAFAIEPATNTPPAVPAPTGKTDAKTPPATAKVAAQTPAPALAAPAPSAPTVKLDDYINALSAAVNLSDNDKKQIEALYTADGTALQNICSNDTLSPLVQAQQIADLREVRNGKIETILHDLDRQKTFDEVEATYRVSMTELAMQGGLVPPAPPAPATPPAAASTPAKPATPAPAASTNAAPAAPTPSPAK